MPDLTFWIGIVIAVAVIVLLTWIGAMFTRRAQIDDWAEGQDRPLIPGPPNQWTDD